jgi:RimJ/RimL family protein N-acetyltransferase
VVQFVYDPDPRHFADLARPFLDAHIECNVLATVLLRVLADRFTRTPTLVRGLDDQERVVAVALRAPPWPMICSGLDPNAADPLISSWLNHDPELNGVNSLASTARALAAAWRDRTGGRTQCRTSMALHSLELVTDPPRPGPGGLVRASRDQRDLLTAWWSDFAREAGVFGGGADASNAVRARLEHGGLWLWERGGTPVSMVASNPSVAGVVRLGPVYTPPEHRRRGYAGAAVAAVSRRALQDGARTCMLFTDLANPTSNKIYSEVGYRRFAAWEEHTFSLAAPTTSSEVTP